MVLSPGFRIIKFKIVQLLDNLVAQHVFDCKTADELEEQLTDNPSTTFAIVCHQNHLLDIAPIIRDRPIDKLLVVMDDHEGFFPIELLNHPAQLTEIRNKCHVKRYICTTALLYLHQQAQEHKANGNVSLANRCLQDALHALNCATQYQ
jgi:hypothetical protein